MKLTVVSIYWSETLAFYRKFMWKTQCFSSPFPTRMRFSFFASMVVCVLLFASVSFQFYTIWKWLERRQMMRRCTKNTSVGEELVTLTHLRRIKYTYYHSNRHVNVVMVQNKGGLVFPKRTEPNSYTQQLHLRTEMPTFSYIILFAFSWQLSCIVYIYWTATLAPSMARKAPFLRLLIEWQRHAGMALNQCIFISAD